MFIQDLSTAIHEVAEYTEYAFAASVYKYRKI